MTILEDTRQQVGKHVLKHNFFQATDVAVVRCKIPFGDYCPAPPVSIDTKASMDEIAGNIGGREHRRFVYECKAAKAAGCKLIILIENTLGITDISQVHTWVNPRAIYSPGCIQGPRLQKAMETISERYGVTFLFCSPEESGKIITKILGAYDYERKQIT